MKNVKKALILASLVALTACSSVKKELGVGRQSPDEFTVVKRAPLTLPPDYNLRPPSDGSAVQESEAVQQAKTIVLGTPAATVEAGNAETAIMQKMGTDKRNPSIRDQINKDNGYIALQNRSVKDKLLFWKDQNGAPADDGETSTVDAKAETVRLEKNKQEGKPVTEGDVPVVIEKKSTIDKLFK